MQQNVGSLDKIVRVIIGLGLLALLFIVEGNIRWIGLIGVVPIFTALTGWCPAYSLFGMNTTSQKH